MFGLAATKRALGLPGGWMPPLGALGASLIGLLLSG